jgi:hypothetical protein
VYVLILFWEVHQVQITLNLINFVLFNHSLHSNESDVLVFFKLPTLLALLSATDDSVMFSILNRGIDHLMIKLIRVPSSCLLAQFLYNQ